MGIPFLASAAVRDWVLFMRIRIRGRIASAMRPVRGPSPVLAKTLLRARPVISAMSRVYGRNAYLPGPPIVCSRTRARRRGGVAPGCPEPAKGADQVSFVWGSITMGTASRFVARHVD